MKIITTLFTLSVLSWGLLFTAEAQLSDPIPGSLVDGDLELRLVEWIQIPNSAGQSARINQANHANDGSNRLFVNDQRGPFYVIDNDLVSVYLNLSDELPDYDPNNFFGTGFHGFAFHPGFANNGLFYTVHMENRQTGTADLEQTESTNVVIHSIITEWTASTPSANQFSGTRREVLRIEEPAFNHTIQQIGFNPNVGPGDSDYGMLYVSQGDGSILPTNRPQTLNSPHGKILRIDPAGSNGSAGRYGIPSDNPFVGNPDSNLVKEIWAYGFRNPHNFSWDTGGTGLMLVTDIGEANIEEVNIGMAGKNYGWEEREGTFLFNSSNPGSVYELPSNDSSFDYEYPVAQYDHDSGFAIAGGFVYRGTEIPELQGTYLFGDIFNGRIFYAAVSDFIQGQQANIQRVKLVNTEDQSVNLRDLTGLFRVDLRFGMTETKEIVVLTKTDGKIRRLESTNPIVLDFDSDGTPDSLDNCREVANPDQRDTDNDGFGNVCDPDLNNDNIVNLLDVAQFANVFGQSNEDADFNGDGAVNFIDFSVLTSYYLRPPGP